MPQDFSFDIVSKTEMQEVTNQVVDKHRLPANPQRLAKKYNALGRAEVVNEQIATDQIEARVGEGALSSSAVQGSARPDPREWRCLPDCAGA